MKTNRSIDALLQGTFAIDIDYGLEALAAYMHELVLLESGVKLTDLGMSARRKESAEFQMLGLDGSSYDAASDDRYIVKERLNGVMRLEDSMSSQGIRSMADRLYEHYTNDKVAGIILEITSGGGDVSAANLLTTTLKDRNKPVYSFVHSAGSAAYSAAANTDLIVMSDESSQVGSIGAMVTIDKKMVAEFKKQFISIYGETSKDKNKEFRAIIESDDFSLIKEHVSTLAKQFQARVATSRNIELSSDALKGKMFFADDAIALNLADKKLTYFQTLELMSSAIVGESTSHSITKYTNDMKFKDSPFFKSVATWFGWTEEAVASVETEALAAEFMANQPTLQARIDNANNAVSDKLNALSLKYTALEERFNNLQEASVDQATVNAVSEKLASQEAMITTLTATNTDLSAKVKSLATGGETDATTETAPPHTSSTLESFEAKVGELATVANDSKY
jgi:ClpP class serine protease